MIRTKGLSVMLLILELLLGLVEFLCLSGCGNDREEYEYIYYPEGTSWKEIVTTLSVLFSIRFIYILSGKTPSLRESNTGKFM